MNLTDKEVLASVQKHGSIRAAARELNIPKSTMQDRFSKAEQNAFTSKQRDNPLKVKNPRAGAVKRFILSSAQDGTEVHVPFLRNLEAYAAYHDAEMLIGEFTYNKSAFSGREPEEAAFAPELAPYLTNRRIEMGPNLVFCAEMNTSPSATNPLSALEGYTRSRSGIFPHAKVALQSIATMKFEHPKQNMTTGAVTKPNYIQKKTGKKAEFHHAYAALIVELCPDGTFYPRQLHGDDVDGSFYDLDNFVVDGVVTSGHNALSLTYGDIHHKKLDPFVAEATWGKGGLLDRVKPGHQVFHDLNDFAVRNPHNTADPHFMFSMYVKDTESVEEELRGCSYFLNSTKRDYSKSIVVESNHDNMLVRWLKSADYKTDPANALFFLETQLSYYKYLQQGFKERDIPVFENTLRGFSPNDLLGIEFLQEDESYIIGGVEHGLHGHKGANGSRGTPRQFTKIGPKVTHGHTHSPSIIEGVYTTGVSGLLDMGYNKGPSSWAQTHCIQYTNGKRALITIINGKYCA